MDRAHVLFWPELPNPSSGRHHSATAASPWDALLDRVAIGDSAACATLYDHSATAAFSLILHIVRDRTIAEEALRDFYVSVAERAARHERRGRDPQAWLLSLARAAAINRLRANPKAATSPAFDKPTNDVSPASTGLTDEQPAILQMVS